MKIWGSWIPNLPIDRAHAASGVTDLGNVVNKTTAFTESGQSGTPLYLSRSDLPGNFYRTRFRYRNSVTLLRDHVRGQRPQKRTVQMMRFTDLPKVDLEAPKLLRVKPGNKLHIKLLNVKYVGVDTHYWGGHTIACPGPETCKACGSGLVAVFSGFIFCQLWGGGRVALLALTPVMCANILQRVKDAHGFLGMKVAFWRKTKEINSGVCTAFHGFDDDFDEQTQERLVSRVRIIFKDYVIEDKGPVQGPSSPASN